MAKIRTIAGVTILSVAAAMVAGTFANASETINYTYDVKGRLIKAEHSGTINNNVVANYTFDKVDNRKAVIVTGAAP